VASHSLVFAATDDRKVNQRVFEDAEQNGVWVNVADDPDLCSFHLPSRVRRGAFQLAVASAGEAPFVVRRMRQLLEGRFGPEWAEWIEAAARFRRSVRQLKISGPEQEELFDTFFSSTVDGKTLTARVPTGEEEQCWLQSKPAEQCEQPEAPTAPVTPEPTRRARKTGFVSLVGAGPGDAGLLTLRGYKRLHAADAVVYDNLAVSALPCDLGDEVELRCVGKQAGHHPVPQEEINNLLVRLAGSGKWVVRLKGGDPFVFGRGGEEAEALFEAGIPFEVVPAVTAGVAVPAYAGIPVTHRREVVRLTMVTAHEAVKEDGPQVRWDLLAADPHATLVGYMGVTSLPSVVGKLLDAGMDPSTPAAMIERGTTPGQRIVKASLDQLPGAVEQAGLNPPGLFVIGPTIHHAPVLDWFTRRPLFGVRVLLTAPAGQTGEALELAGAQVVEVPLPVTPAARVVIGAAPLNACFFRDSEELEALEDERDGPGFGPDVVAWCQGPATARRARQLLWSQVEAMEDPLLPDSLVSRMRERYRSRIPYSRPEIRPS
jgi:uroporphyrin-III C-methyltransferase/precorrin-2 dehydrogenase/sirohydrochlorin ferrochelatase